MQSIFFLNFDRDRNNLDIQQFGPGFISQEILELLLNHNVYTMIARQKSHINNKIYLYKKGLHYQLFTLIIQGNATLESGEERIISTVGPFSYFGTTALTGRRN